MNHPSKAIDRYVRFSSKHKLVSTICNNSSESILYGYGWGETQMHQPLLKKCGGKNMPSAMAPDDHPAALLEEGDNRCNNRDKPPAEPRTIPASVIRRTAFHSCGEVYERLCLIPYQGTANQAGVGITEYPICFARFCSLRSRCCW
jgi:hypothetical protein